MSITIIILPISIALEKKISQNTKKYKETRWRHVGLLIWLLGEWVVMEVPMCKPNSETKTTLHGTCT